MKQPSDAGHAKLAIAGWEDIAAWGWDCDRLVQELIALRYDCIEGLKPEGQPRPEEWSEICLEWPDTWRVLTAGPENIVGYWHSLPFTEPALQLAKAGKVQSGTITRKMLVPLSSPGWYDLYVATLAIREPYRGIFAGMLVLQSMLEITLALAKKRILVRELCANFFSADGQMLNEGLGLGLDYVTDHETTGVIYAGHFPSLLERQVALHGRDTFPVLRELTDCYGETA